MNKRMLNLLSDKNKLDFLVKNVRELESLVSKIICVYLEGSNSTDESTDYLLCEIRETMNIAYNNKLIDERWISDEDIVLHNSLSDIAKGEELYEKMYKNLLK